MSELVVEENAPVLGTDFIKEVVRQVRAVDAYGMYENYSEARLLDPFVLTAERKKAIPLVADPDEIVISRLTAYYNAVAASIEKADGRMAVPVLSLSHEGFGRILIIVGRLVVLNRTLRDVHRFGFSSLEAMSAEAEKLIGEARELVNAHPDVVDL